MKKSSIYILEICAVVMLNLIGVFAIRVKHDIGVYCLKDYMIFTIHYFFQWIVLPCVLLIVIAIISREITPNHIARYVYLYKFYVHLCAVIFRIAVISGALTTLSVIVYGVCFLRLPVDNWKAENSYAAKMYGGRLADLSVLGLCAVVMISVIFLIYVLSCLCVIIYRICHSLYIGFLIGMILVVLEFGSSKIPVLLYYGVISLSIYNEDNYI